jgi:hypothetical protein
MSISAHEFIDTRGAMAGACLAGVSQRSQWSYNEVNSGRLMVGPLHLGHIFRLLSIDCSKYALQFGFAEMPSKLENFDGYDSRAHCLNYCHD